MMKCDFTEIRNSDIFGKGWLWPKNDTICWNFFNKPIIINETSNNPSIFPYDIIPYVTKRSTVIQAGGNSGLYAKIYSEFFETVMTFEPDPVWFKCLSHNVAATNVYKFQCCLGDGHDCLAVETPIWDKMNFGAMHVSGVGTIPQLTIDSLKVKPDLIHLDIEGFELNALRGAEETISTHRPVIVLEVNDLLCKQFGHCALDIDHFLKRFGYSRKRVWTEDAPYGTQDIMFTVE